LKKCGHCGFINKENSKFCDKCGEKLDSLLSGDPRGIRGLDVKPYSFWREFPILILAFLGMIILSVITYLLYTIFGNIYIFIAAIASIIIFFGCLLKIIIALYDWSKESKPKKKKHSS
jgi:uncharacterized membrane protein YvbJ